MPTDVVMPQMGESITEGTITKWLKKVGEAVQRDEPLFEISTDKVDAEIPSPAAGVLRDIQIAEGTTVTINTVVCSIEEGSSASAPSPAAETAATPAADSATPAAVDTPAANENPPEPSAVEPAAAEAPGTEVLMPQMGESITEGTITKWLKKVGDSVQRDEPIFEISTDKVDAEIPSPVAGKLTEIKVAEGSTVTINTVVAVIGGGSTAKAAAPATKQGRSRRRIQHQRHLPRTPRPLKAADESSPRRSSARSPVTTTSTSPGFLVLEPPAVSPSPTSSATLKVERRPHPRLLRRPHRPSPVATSAPVMQASLSAVQSAPATSAPAKAAAPTPQPGRTRPDDQDALHHREAHGRVQTDKPPRPHHLQGGHDPHRQAP